MKPRRGVRTIADVVPGDNVVVDLTPPNWELGEQTVMAALKKCLVQSPFLVEAVIVSHERLAVVLPRGGQRAAIAHLRQSLSSPPATRSRVARIAQIIDPDTFTEYDLTPSGWSEPRDAQALARPFSRSIARALRSLALERGSWWVSTTNRVRLTLVGRPSKALDRRIRSVGLRERVARLFTRCQKRGTP